MDPHNNVRDDASDLKTSRESAGTAGSDFSRTSTHKPDDKTRREGASVSSNTTTSNPAQISDSKTESGTDLSDDAKMEQIIREMVRDFGPDRFAIFVYLGLFGITFVLAIGFFILSWPQITAFICLLFGFIVWRHMTIKREHPRPATGRSWISQRNPTMTPNTANLPAVYWLYILGSGGHTTEMLEMIKRKFRPQANAHRRYLFTAGDTDSLTRVAKLESLIRRTFPQDADNNNLTGTFDAFSIPRARKVHQPFWTAPFTCLATALHAIKALTREPDARPSTLHGAQFKYPHVVVTNGPATGFVVCLVAHLLRVFYLVPAATRLKMVYVESWARSRTLSLTGRLFLWSGIADMFAVQHEELARRYEGVVYVGKVGARFVPPSSPA